MTRTHWQVEVYRNTVMIGQKLFVIQCVSNWTSLHPFSIKISNSSCMYYETCCVQGRHELWIMHYNKDFHEVLYLMCYDTHLTVKAYELLLYFRLIAIPSYVSWQYEIVCPKHRNSKCSSCAWKLVLYKFDILTPGSRPLLVECKSLEVSTAH